MNSNREPLKKPLFRGIAAGNNKSQFAQALSNLIVKDTLFVCIGTKLCMGDSVGPRIGSILESKGFNVLGTMENNVHALNLRETINDIDKNVSVFAIDAAVSNCVPRGTVSVYDSAVKPGNGAGKELPWVGSQSLSIVTGTNIFELAQRTPEWFVQRLAGFTADCIVEAVEIQSRPLLKEA